MLAAAIGLALAACGPSSSDEGPTTTETAGDEAGSAASSSGSEGSGGPGYVARSCGVAGEQLLPHMFDEEPDCNVLLGGLHYSDQSGADLGPIARLRAVHGTLSLFRNERLTSMHGLEGLESVGDLIIHHHPVLADLGALARLREVPGELYLALNGALAGLDGLEQLRSVGSLEISTNSRLSSLAGLAGLERVTGDVTIRDNPKLSQQAAEAFVARLEVGGAIEVVGNGS